MEIKTLFTNWAVFSKKGLIFEEKMEVSPRMLRNVENSFAFLNWELGSEQLRMIVQSQMIEWNSVRQIFEFLWKLKFYIRLCTFFATLWNCGSRNDDNETTCSCKWRDCLLKLNFALWERFLRKKVAKSEGNDWCATFLQFLSVWNWWLELYWPFLLSGVSYFTCYRLLRPRIAPSIVYSRTCMRMLL